MYPFTNLYFPHTSHLSLQSLFYSLFIWVYFLKKIPHVSDTKQDLSVSVWLISLSTTAQVQSVLSQMTGFPFLMLNSIDISLSILDPFIHLWTQVVSVPSLLWIMLQWTWEHSHHQGYDFVSSGYIPRVELLNHT